MKYAASTFMVMILMVLVGTAVWAACGSCQAPVVQQQFTCPAVVTQVCPGPCEQVAQTCDTCQQVAQCPQPCCAASIPAAVGAGPQGGLAGLTCPDFDPAYMQRMYQQNATIIAVTQVGIQRASNRNLRDISREIYNQLTSANQKMMPGFSSCGCLTADPAQAQAIINELCGSSGACFDVTYAKTLSALLKQSQEADNMAISQSSNAQLQQQAQFMAAKENDWTFRLDRWVNDHGY